MTATEAKKWLVWEKENKKGVVFRNNVKGVSRREYSSVWTAPEDRKVSGELDGRKLCHVSESLVLGI